MISNITAGSNEQIQLVIDNGIIPLVVNLLLTADFDTKKEAAWAISNALSGGSVAQITHLVECHCIKPLIELLSALDAKIVIVALGAIESILKAGMQRQQEEGWSENLFANIVEQFEGLTKIEDLQQDPNADIYTQAIGILEKFFPVQDDTPVDDVGDSQAFAPFGAPLPPGGFHFG